MIIQSLTFTDRLSRRCRMDAVAGALLTLLVGACTSAPLLQEAPAGVPAAVTAPSVSTGDSWTYRVRDGFTGLPREDQHHRVTRVGGDRIEIAGTVEKGDGSQVYNREWNWLRRPATDLQTFEYNPAYEAFAFPLTPGKTWRSETTATDPRDGRRFPVWIQGKVLGWERVRVPAGEFDALKVERRVFISYWEHTRRGHSEIHEIDWYAPAVKWAVKREARATIYSYTGIAANDSGFIRVERDGGGGPRYVKDDWFVYELASFTGR